MTPSPDKKIEQFLMYINPDDRDMARDALEALLASYRASVIEVERKEIGKAIRKLIENRGNETEIACNDLLNYSEFLQKALSQKN
jgi:methionine aminopeptidase